MTTLCSYDLNGKKLSFANWISNLSPQETPFTSMTGKESINQTLFQWQTDSLSKAAENAQIEGAEAVEGAMKVTSVKSNITQILRKTVKVSDTANALANYGRGRELQYQMEKAGKEIKRDLEWTFLNNVGSVEEDAAAGIGRQTAGFRGLVAGLGALCPETGARVHASTHDFDPTGGTTDLTEKALFEMTYNLYLAGSRADIIMFHPKHASFFSSLQEKADGSRQRIFENTPKFSVYVSTLVDPLGQEYKLIPNRWMPEGTVYFFNTSDWTQMVLRAPSRTKLAKDGSYEKWMVEMEVGLRHRHPFASGVLDIGQSTAAGSPHNPNTDVLAAATNVPKIKYGMGWETVEAMQSGTAAAAGSEKDMSTGTHSFVAQLGTALTIKGYKSSTNYPVTVRVLKDGKAIFQEVSSGTNPIDWTAADKVIIPVMTKADAGIYVVEASAVKDGVEHIYVSYGTAVSVSAGQHDNIAAPTLV